jgi:type I restriction enzyme S subunit
MVGDPVTNPKGWPVKPLGELAEIATGGTPSRDQSGYYGGTTPWVKTGEVNWGTIMATEEHLTDRAVRESNCKVFPVGTLLVAMYGQGTTRGKCALLGVPAATNQACAAILPNEDWESYFLFEQIRLSYSRLRELARGGNQENLNLALVRSLPVVAPGRKQQYEFAQVASRLRAARRRLDQAWAVGEDLFNALVSGAFSGQLSS